MNPLGPEFLDDDQVCAALATRDIGALYRLLKRLGMSQRQIAGLTDQTQSEVCEILKGRQVLNVHLLERITDGLGIPRERMGLSYGEKRPAVAKEVDAKVKRRILIAAAMGETYLSWRGEPITVPVPTSTDDPLPTRLSMDHIHKVRTLTDQLVGRARYYGGQAGLFGDVVRRFMRWMEVPASEEVTARLAAALVELHTEAGWAYYDSGLDGTGYFARGLELAYEYGDAYGGANAAWHAGVTLVRSGYPNDALKLFTLGKLRLEGFRFGKPTPAIPLAAAHRPTCSSPRSTSAPGNPQGLVLARQAINAVSTLHSVAVRQEMLIPLAAALEARPGTDTRDLARTARQVAATRT